MLSAIAPKSLTTFSIQICPYPKFQIGPTDTSYPEPPSSSGLSHCQNLNNSDPPIQISVPPRWPCRLFVACCNCFCPTDNCNWSHQDGLTNSLLPCCSTLVPPRWCNQCHRDEIFPKPLHIGPSELFRSVPLRFLMFIFLHRSVPPRWVKSVWWLDFVWRLYIRLHPLFI